MKSYTVYLEKDEDGLLVGSIPSIPGCYTQASSLDELIVNLKEVVILCNRNNKNQAESQFVGIQKIEVAI